MHQLAQTYVVVTPPTNVAPLKDMQQVIYLIYKLFLCRVFPASSPMWRLSSETWLLKMANVQVLPVPLFFVQAGNGMNQVVGLLAQGSDYSQLYNSITPRYYLTVNRIY